MLNRAWECKQTKVDATAYPISRKHVPTKMGEMYFGTWIDAEGELFDTAHFNDSLKKYPFQGRDYPKSGHLFFIKVLTRDA